MNLPSWVRWFLTYKSFFFLIFYPILLCPLVIVSETSQAKGAYALLLMAGYWITECIPIYVTALLPLIMAPLMGLMSSNDTCIEYMRDSNMLFIGGAFLAVATEHRNLHRRIGVAVLTIMGGDPRMLMLGLMLPTWFLSMWMSNAAATIMMLTIVEALITRLETANLDEEQIALQPNSDGSAWENGDTHSAESVTARPVPKVVQSHKEELRKFGAGLSLGIAFASSCGGMGTVIGTPTNVVFLGMVNERYGPDTSLSFGTWAAYAIPISLLCLLCCWVVLGMIFIGPKKFFALKSGGKSRNATIKAILDEEKASLGSVQWAEGTCMLILAFVVFLWVSRKPGVPGWSQLVPEGINPKGKNFPLTTDTQPAMLGTVLFMVLPAFNPFGKKPANYKATETVLPWSVAQSKCPWGVLILIGGGFALSKMCSESGLSLLVGQNLIALKTLPLIALVYVLTIIGSVITTFVANAATATVLLPIMFQVAETLHVHPFYLSLPVTLAASLAFVLPAATPANAIVFGKDRVKMIEMIKAGFIICLCGQLVVVLCTCSYAVPLFGLNEYPLWAPNITLSSTTVAP